MRCIRYGENFSLKNKKIQSSFIFERISDFEIDIKDRFCTIFENQEKTTNDIFEMHAKE